MTPTPHLALVHSNAARKVRPKVDPVAPYLSRLGPGTRPAARSGLEAIARIASDGRCGMAEFDSAALTYLETSTIRAELACTRAPGTANRMLSCLRGVLKECFRHGLIDADTWLRASDLDRVPGTAPSAGRLVTAGEVQALLAAYDADENAVLGARNAALIAVGTAAGLRRAELVGLDLADWYSDDARLEVRHAKGGRRRVVWLAPWAVARLEAWVDVRGDEAGPLLLAVTTAGTVWAGRLTGDAVRRRLSARAGETQIEPLSPHDLRRSLVSRLFDEGVDLGVVQRIAGHADVGTTVRYDRRPEERAREAMLR